MDFKGYDKLIAFGDPQLARKPEQFDFEKEDAKALEEHLYERQKHFEGAGLSANQLGIDRAVFTMTVGDEFKRCMFNPVLLAVSDKTVPIKEGCLSFPGLWLVISRPEDATFRYQDSNGEEQVEKFVDVAARIALHEFDHMIGKNFTQRASRLKIERAVKALDKKVKKFKRNQNAYQQLLQNINKIEEKNNDE